MTLHVVSTQADNFAEAMLDLRTAGAAARREVAGTLGTEDQGTAGIRRTAPILKQAAIDYARGICGERSCHQRDAIVKPAEARAHDGVVVAEGRPRQG